MTVDLRRPPAEGSLATWRDLRQPCVPAQSLPALRPGMILASLASDVLFQHHFLPRNITSALGGLIPDVGEPMTVDLLIPVGV